MDRLTEYRQQAIEARRLAQSADSPNVRDLLTTMAQTWEDLADELVRHRTEKSENDGAQA
jgi:hypothetical protein